MIIPTETYRYLIEHGFEKTESAISEYFGDYCDVFSNGGIFIKFTCDKSVETIEIRSAYHDDTWYDLSLIKALLDDMPNLALATSIEENCVFLRNNLLTMQNLFTNVKYPTTKNRLKVLNRQRFEQMFPKLRT
jgi:hypothetical protein